MTGGTLRLADLTESGRLEHAPRSIGAPAGASITAFHLDCSSAEWSSCRGVMTFVGIGQVPALGAFGFKQDGSPTPIVQLGSLTSGPFADPLLCAPTASLSEVFFAEESGARARIRRLSLGW